MHKLKEGDWARVWKPVDMEEKTVYQHIGWSSYMDQLVGKVVEILSVRDGGPFNPPCVKAIVIDEDDESCAWFYHFDWLTPVDCHLDITWVDKQGRPWYGDAK